MDTANAQTYPLALFAVTVLAISAFALVVHLLQRAGLLTASARLYFAYFLLGAIGWLVFGLMEARLIPGSSALAGSANILSSLALLLAVVETLQRRAPAIALGVLHLVLVLAMQSVTSDVALLRVLAGYALLAYPFIAYAAFRRAHAERNIGHTLIGAAASLYSASAIVSLVSTLLYDRPDVGVAAHIIGVAVGFNLVGIGFLSSTLIERLRQLREMALNDPLTGLRNRRGMDFAADTMLRGAERLRQPVCIVAMDIDHFKRINDSHGHDVGDAVLKRFGKLVKQHARASDISCRLGGEEFVIVLINADLNGGAVLAERIRADVEQLKIRHRELTLQVTCSFGVAAAQGKVHLDSLLKDADKALYRAKADGRNLVRLATST